MKCCDADSDPDVQTQLCEDDWGCIVERTDGYSGSDMRNLIHEACSFAVHEVLKDAVQSAAPLALGIQDIRPVNLQDFQVGSAAPPACSYNMQHTVFSTGLHNGFWSCLHVS